MPLNPCLRSGAILVFVTALPAQVTWSSLVHRAGHGMASDLGRATMVVFGGEGPQGALLRDTWEQGANNAWTQKYPDTRPDPVRNHALSFWTDGVNRGHVLMFGGVDVGGRNARTWVYTGDNWVLVPPAADPSPRDSHAMALDTWRQRIVLFGGVTALGANGHTWEWDGATWTRRTPLQSPSPRYGHSMAFDAVNGRAVLFGGNGDNQETWEFDSAANTWIPRPTGAGNTPPGRLRGAMTFDITTSKIVLFGGETTTGALNDTWVWEPALQPAPGWVQQAPANRPPPRTGHRLDYDSSPIPQGLLLIGGKSPGGSPIGDSWVWNGSNWVQHLPPQARNLSPMAFDSRRPGGGASVLFGGQPFVGAQALGDTWELRGCRWIQISPPVSPPSRYSHGFVYMLARNRSILFGGSTNAVNGRSLNDTWEWDGITWRSLPGLSPARRRGHLMVYDSRRDRIILFGGETCDNLCYQNDTWEFDGSAWTSISTATAPPPQAWGSMTFDDKRARAVLFGGINTPFTELWEYEPANTNRPWQLMPQTGAVPPNLAGQMVYDKLRERTVFFDGNGLTYEWDGVRWDLRSPPVSPPQRFFASITYDDIHNQVVMFGGSSGVHPVFNDTWFYHPENTASVDWFGSGCAGTAGVPALAAGPNQRPWAGGSFEIVGSNLVRSGISFVFLGFDRDSWNSVPLNHPIGFPLQFFGMPSCRLLAGGDVILAMGHTAAGTGSMIIPVPLGLSLLGFRFYMQLFSSDVGANAFGATTSNGLNCRIGGQ